MMRLLTKEIANRLPKLYSTESIPIGEKVAVVKFFDPTGSWTWYGIEFDPKERLFFGLVIGHEKELGYFSLDELASVRGRFGLGIERDIHFRPTKLKDLGRDHELSGCDCGDDIDLGSIGGGTVTYAKLQDGSWGLRGDAQRLVSGAQVTVSKRDGTSKVETVGQVVWTKDGVAIATIARTAGAASPSARSYGPPRAPRGCSCTEPGCCRPRCQCDSHCVCRGGNIYDCG